jgi:hypothetical protein
LGFTHNYFYEYGVIARGYGLGLGLALLGASKSMRATKPTNVSLMVRGQLLAGLAMLTSVHVALFVTCCNLAILSRQYRNRSLAIWIPATQAPFLGFLAILMSLSIAQRQATIGGVLGLSGFGEFAATAVSGFFDFDLWRLVSFLDGGNLLGRYFLDAIYPDNWWPLAKQLKSTLSPVWRLIFVIMLYFVLVLGSGKLLRKRQRDLLIAISLTFAGLALFFARAFPDYLRHTLVVFIPLMILFIAFTLTVKSQVMRWSFVLFLSSIVWLQLLGTARSLRMDQANPFSSTRAIAENLPEGAELLVSSDYKATSIALYRPDVKLRAPEHRGKGFVFVEWDSARNEKASAEDLVTNTCRDGLVIFTTFEFKCTELQLSPSSELAKTDELLSLYRLPCDCLSKQKH